MIATCSSSPDPSCSVSVTTWRAGTRACSYCRSSNRRRNSAYASLRDAGVGEDSPGDAAASAGEVAGAAGAAGASAAGAAAPARAASVSAGVISCSPAVGAGAAGGAAVASGTGCPGCAGGSSTGAGAACTSIHAQAPVNAIAATLRRRMRALLSSKVMAGEICGTVHGSGQAEHGGGPAATRG